MAKKNPGYAMKSPRGRPHDLVARSFDHIEDSRVATSVLDKGLVLFIIAELLHTVRVTIQERTLVVEPFLIVGVIAGIRRLLLITAQTAEDPRGFQWNPQGIEITVLLALVLGITVALILLRRFYGRTQTATE